MQVGTNTLSDLEFKEILIKISNKTLHPVAKNIILNIYPETEEKTIIRKLDLTWEFLATIQSGNTISLGDYHFDEEYLERLDIENYHLNEEVFFGIRTNLEQVKVVQKFIDQIQEYYPTLAEYILSVDYKNELLKCINDVFKRNGDIKTTASKKLEETRQKLGVVSSKIDAGFRNALKHYNQYLDNIKESIIDERRVLAVTAGMRRRVPGKSLGTSKTGSIIFVEPNAVVPLYNEKSLLIEEEKEEIIKILIDLTAYLALFKNELSSYQNLLVNLDVIRAKSQYAYDLNAIKPEIKTEDKSWNLIQAYHPILLEENNIAKKKTIAQDICMNPKQRIIVISGPNAGGKSITLKTIGLLQLMIQSGILVPVKKGSHFSIIQKIYTDIGDHQSIENRLSTYSYRLKQMNYFLRKTDENTLLLIDEFGTGSDPLMGGALSEVFLEDFYDRKCFAIFTSHYTNIKIRTETLEHAINANMLFDQKNLEPTYQLVIGEAGSSFTFEVAQKNKIPFSVINRAKKKIEKEKLKFDKTISKLQNEKLILKEAVSEMKINLAEQDEGTKQIKSTKEKIQNKLIDFQLLYTQNQKELSVGKKMMALAENYIKEKKKKKTIGQFLKWLEMEAASSFEKKTKPFSLKKIEKKVKEDVKNQSIVIEEKIAEKKEAVIKKEKEYIDSLVIGQRVRIKGSKSIGTIERLGKRSILINYGRFTTDAPIKEVEKI